MNRRKMTIMIRWLLLAVLTTSACDDGSDLGAAESRVIVCKERVGLYRSEATLIMGECHPKISGGTFEPATETTAHHLDSCTTEYDNKLEDGTRVRAHMSWSRDGLSAEGLMLISEPECDSLWVLKYTKI